MSKAVRNARRSSTQKRRGNSRKASPSTLEEVPRNLASLIRGLYGRVARRLDVDPSYVSRVARGERRSQVVERELKRELNQIVKQFSRRPQS
jgi:hypothetical protein